MPQFKDFGYLCSGDLIGQRAVDALHNTSLFVALTQTVVLFLLLVKKSNNYILEQSSSDGDQQYLPSLAKVILYINISLHVTRQVFSG